MAVQKVTDQYRQCTDQYRLCTDQYRQCTDQYRQCTDQYRQCTDQYRQFTDQYRQCTDQYSQCTDQYSQCTDQCGQCTDQYSQCTDQYSQCTDQHTTSQHTTPQHTSPIMTLVTTLPPIIPQPFHQSPLQIAHSHAGTEKLGMPRWARKSLWTSTLTKSGRQAPQLRHLSCSFTPEPTGRMDIETSRLVGRVSILGIRHRTTPSVGQCSI